MTDRFGAPNLILLLIAILTGCAPAVEPSSASHPEAALPSALPTQSSSPMTAPAPELVEIAVDGLSIGHAPEGLDLPDISITPRNVPAGIRAWVLESVDDWNLLVTMPLPDDVLTTPIGWAPAELDGAPTLRPVDLVCPPPQLMVPQLASLGWLGGLACYGNGVVELIGFTPVGCGIGSSPVTGTPEWLNGTWTSIAIGDQEPLPPDYEVDIAVSARAAPGVPMDLCGAAGWYRFRGHFDDPASGTCRTEESVGAAIIVEEPRVSEVLCRAELVLDAKVRLANRP
jgi:hypothetical protein